MKYLQFTFAILFGLLLSASVSAQEVDRADSTGLDGDHFSLEGALELFKDSKSLEDFEKQLKEAGASAKLK